jgi:alpha-ketoglutarate-dependent taurine dioxygenase
METSKFAIGRRKPVDLSSFSPVREHLPEGGGTLPLILEPAHAGAMLSDWAGQHRDEIEAYLSRHGAILFRGFGLSTIAHFESVATSITGGLYGGYGDLPRAGASENIYASTPFPNDMSILFHNESSHLSSWPMKIAFFCMIPSQTGGETPLLDCREICREMRPALLEKFARLGVTYVRNFGDGLDVSWQQFFRTEDRSAVEETCKAEGLECEWKTGNGLRIRHRTHAVATHPRTAEQIFFNQIQLHHPYCLGKDVRESLLSIYHEEDLPRNVYYGDGSVIEDSVMEELDELYWRLDVELPWQAGDIILLDNMLTAHARKPFSGDRKICVAMGQMMERSTLLATTVTN